MREESPRFNYGWLSGKSNYRVAFSVWRNVMSWPVSLVIQSNCDALQVLRAKYHLSPKPSNTHTIALSGLSCCNPEFSGMQPWKLPKPKKPHGCSRKIHWHQEKGLQVEEVICNNDPGNREWPRGTMEMEKGDSRPGNMKIPNPSPSSIISWWPGNLLKIGFVFSHKGPIHGIYVEFHIHIVYNYFLNN